MTSTTGASRGLDKISFIIFQVVLFFTPLFFIPSVSVPLQTGRSAFILIGIVLAFIFWAIARLKDGVFEMPKTWLYAGAGIFALAYALAAVFSPNHPVSYSGSGLELGTLAFFLPSLLLFALVPLVVRRSEEIFYSYATILGSFFLVALFHIVRFIGGPDTLSFGILTDATSAILGKWNDVGVFFGLTALVSLITLERATLGRLMKVLAYVAFVISLAMVVIVNFSPVWVALAVLSLVFLVHKMSFDKSGSLGARIPYRALIVLILSVLFVFGGSKIGSLIADSLGTSQVEVRPSWAATLEVSKATLKDDPLFGAGPNRFSSEWLAAKPDGINSTIFWNVDFNYGIGFLPSLVATTGIIGGLAALAFVVLFALLAVKALFRQESSPFSRYLVLSSLFGSAYLWIFSIVYVPSAGLWVLTLAMTGLFVAALREDKVIASGSISVLDRPAASFVSVLLTILGLIAAVAFAYFVAVKLLSGIYFQKGVIAANTTGDIEVAERNIGKALDLSPSDAYYRSLSEIYLVRINTLLQDTKVTQSEAQSQFQGLLSAAIQSAQAAVAFDPTNYQNHLSLGRIYEAVVPLKIEGAYASAKASYETALSVNPSSPEIFLVLARLETVNEDATAAKDYIAKALEKKGDYADAIFLLSQIQIAEGDVANAINSVSAVATLSPNDPGIFFQLGLLYYNQKSYGNSVLALERAITLNPEYANAKYFLGLAYYQANDKDKALVQFQDLAKTNPDNTEIKAIVENLEAGKPPFPPTTNPVTRPNLPVDEN
ncbi:MAG: tetratricopeptide repeat protein [Candidatus Taylorbacteria bacterium]|nr:tetratricopeptide repeat protein [Candidatus Taylorbacteria bacterium]